MPTSRDERIDELLRASLSLPSTEREPFLAESCADDASLRLEVESLLRQHQSEPAGNASTVVDDAKTRSRHDEGPSLIGRRVGNYRVVRELGRGGMGTVYLAVRDDDEFKQRVAIKVIKLGLGTDEIRRRFRAERQILASLDHPNIARLLDGGTTDDGLSYFVMEYVEGTPIDTYCDSHRLGVAARLQLFRTVCSAVHAAHQNLVVHRDIKPNNILVATDGTPKLLDFGIAKLLNPELAGPTIAPTADGVRPMTPAYASPEQLKGESVTTASDVYSLGVLLYLLVTGRRPYRFRSLAPREVERVVCEEEPDKPSITVDRPEEPSDGGSGNTAESISRARDSQPDKLRRQLRGDLDTIVLMALRKEPQRRYSSADAFSQDIARYLDGLTVNARPDTLGYRSSKFVKRNRGAVAATILVGVSLIVGIVVTSRAAQIARREQARAQQRFNDVRSLATFALLDIHDAIADLPGSTRARRLVVDRALEYLNGLAREAGDDQELRRNLALAYERVGDVQGNPYDANLGDVAGALGSFRTALSIRETVVRRDSSPARLSELADSHERLVEVLLSSEDLQGALDHARQSLALRTQLASKAAASEKVDAQRGLARALQLVADARGAMGDYSGSRDDLRQATTISDELSRMPGAGLSERRDLAFYYGRMGRVLSLTNDVDSAQDYGRRALALLEGAAAQEPATRTSRRELAIGYDQSGDLRFAAGDMVGAITNYRKALEIREALLAADPTNVQARRDLATVVGDLGISLARSGARQDALDHIRRATDIFQQLVADDPSNAIAKRDLSKQHQAAGEAFFALGDTAAALGRFEQGITVSEPSARAAPLSAVAQRDLATHYLNAGRAQEALSRRAQDPELRLAHWSAARERYQQSQRTWLDIEARMPQAVLRDRLDEATKAITRADFALTRRTKP